jgi:biopolymer transport protein ExbD
MKFKIPTEGGDEEINMAPMIDMVFLLLIFFMVASHLNALERVPVPLPVAGNSRVPEEARDRQTVTIRSADDTGEQAEIFMNLQQVDIEQFSAAVSRLHEEDENAQLYLRADRRVKHKHIKAVIQVCADVGIVDIIFGTFESGD